MKRYFALPLAAVAAALTFSVSCGQRNEEEDYEALVREKEEAFTEYYRALCADMTLTDGTKDRMLDSCYSVLIDEVEEIASRALAVHPDDSVAVSMVREMYALEVTDGEGLLKIIGTLGPNAQADPFIIKLKSGLETLAQTAEGTMFKDFAVCQPSGETLRLSDFAGKGKYCLVDFWASWCGPCKKEIPNLREVYRKYGSKGLVMVSVAVWDDPQASMDTAAACGIEWHQIVNAQEVPTDLYGIQGIPHIMLIGPDGIILKRDLRGDGIAEEIARYL